MEARETTIDNVYSTKSDIAFTAHLLHYIVTYGGRDNLDDPATTAPINYYRLLPHQSHDLSQLIRTMRSPIAAEWPTATQALKYVVFWDENKIYRFYMKMRQILKLHKDNEDLYPRHQNGVLPVPNHNCNRLISYSL